MTDDPAEHARKRALSKIMPGTRVDGPPVKSETDHFMRCGRCGEMFDMRELGDVFEHETCTPAAK